MNKGALLEWLQRFLSGDTGALLPKDLSDDEAIAARQLEKEFKKAGTMQQYSSAFLQTLEGTERFSEIAVRALSALTRIGSLGETVRDINIFCKHIAEIFTHELELENCLILLKQPPDGQLKVVAKSARADKYASAGRERRKSNVVIGKDIAARVADSGEHVFIPDFGLTSLLSVPIKKGDNMLGVINCGHPHPEAFDENKINLIILLSNFTGQIITLIGLHNKLAAWNEELQEEVRKKTLALQSKNAMLHKLAVTDSLTGLYNRRFFFTRLEEEFSRTTRYKEEFTLLAIDLDNLKTINDVFGHASGDAVLKRIARCLKSSVRKGDVLGRLGGDEFGYIMLGANNDIALHFASRLQDSLSKVTLDNIKHRPTMSIGIAAVRDGKFKKYQDVYKAADTALYAAKKKKNSISIFGKTPKSK